MIQPRPIGTTRRRSFILMQDGSVYVPGVGTYFFKKGWIFEASIPWWAIPLVQLWPLSDCLLWASCIHDWLYCTKLAEFPRPQSDQMMHTVMLMDDTTPWRADVIHRAVRVGGSYGWRHITEQQRLEASTLGYFVPELKDA